MDRGSARLHLADEGLRPGSRELRAKRFVADSHAPSFDQRFDAAARYMPDIGYRKRRLPIGSLERGRDGMPAGGFQGVRHAHALSLREFAEDADTHEPRLAQRQRPGLVEHYVG